jgi:hypothetical protein
MALDFSISSRPLRSVSRRAFGDWTEKRVITTGIVVAVAAVVGQAATQMVDFVFFGLRIPALDSDVHASLFGIISLAAQGAAALAAGLRGVRSTSRSAWFALGAILAVLLGVRAGLPDDPTALAAPLAIVFVLIWMLTIDDPPRVRKLLRVSLLLLAFSFVVHIVGPKIVAGLGYGAGSWPYEIKALLKHSAELSGWTLMATGIIAGSARGISARARQRPRR